MKLKDLDQKQFYIVFGILSVFLLFLILILVLTSSNNFRVREFSSNESNDYVSYTNPSIRIEFNAPIGNANLQDVISFQNADSGDDVEFAASVKGQRIIISTVNALESNTSYEISIDSRLEDIFNRNLAETYTKSFKTNIPSFAYIKKDLAGLDEVIISNIEGNKTTILENPNFERIDANSRFVVASTEEGLNSSIEVYDIENQEKFISKEFESELIRNIKINPITNTIFFTKYPIEDDAGFTIPTDSAKLYRFNVFDDSVEQIDLGEDIREVGEFIVSPDGSSILFKNIFGSEYLLAEIGNWNEQINLGRQLQTGGFNSDSSKIIFTTYDPAEAFSSEPFFLEYSADRDNQKIEELDEFSIDPTYFNKSENIILSQRFKEFENTKGKFEIGTLNSDLEYETLLNNPDVSLELPKISPDDRYVLIEVYSENQLRDFNNFRNFEFQTKPGLGSLLIYDLNQDTIGQDSFNGIEATWLE